MKLNPRKGSNKNAKQVSASELRDAAAVLKSASAKRKRDGDAAGTSPKRHKHVPQHIGCGGAREKLDVNKLDSPSRAQVERNRKKVAAHYLRKKAGGVIKVSEAVLVDPSEAWRMKPSGHVNKHPERARQRAAAELAAALPKNPALHGPAVAAFIGQNPLGKRAAAAMDIQAPQDVATRKASKRHGALSAMASDIGQSPKRAHTTCGSSSCPTTIMTRSRSSFRSHGQARACDALRWHYSTTALSTVLKYVWVWTLWAFSSVLAYLETTLCIL